MASEGAGRKIGSCRVQKRSWMHLLWTSSVNSLSGMSSFKAVSILQLMGKRKSQAFRIFSSAFTMANMSTLQHSASSSSSMSGGAISLILAASRMEARQAALHWLEVKSLSSWRCERQIQMARRVVSGARERKFWLARMEVTPCVQSFSRGVSSLVRWKRRGEVGASRWVKHVLLIIEEVQKYSEFDSKGGGTIYSPNSMNIANKWALSKLLFKRLNTVYAKALLSLKPLTLALIPYEEPIDQLLHKLLQRVNEGARSHQMLVPHSLVVDKVNNMRAFVLSFDEELMPANLLLKKGIKLGVEEILEATKSAMESLEELHSYNYLHGEIIPSTIYFFNRADKLAKGTKLSLEAQTFCGINVLDISVLSSRISRQDTDLNRQIFQSRHVSLGFKATQADDLESLLYVMLHLASGGTMFSVDRYQQQWHNSEGLKKWKISDMLNEMIDKVPEGLCVLLDIIAELQENPRSASLDYRSLISKVEIARENYQPEGNILETVSEELVVPSKLAHSIDEDSEEELLRGEQELLREGEENLSGISEEDIRLNIKSFF